MKHKMKSPIEISEINIVPIKPKDGLLGFCSFVIDQSFFIGSVAIYSRLDGSIRLVYPKKNGVQCCYPIKKEIGTALSHAITKKFNFLFHNENLYDRNVTWRKAASGSD